METGVLLVLAALAFTVLVGGIELWLARHSRRALTRRASVPLHPLSRQRRCRGYAHPARAGACATWGCS
jgi:hypothetical protein